MIFKQTNLFRFLFLFCFVLQTLYSQEKVFITETKDFTFQELNILSEDLVLKGINPRYDFYVPTFPQLSSAEVALRLDFFPYLREDSTITILVNDVPYATYKIKELSPNLIISVSRKKNKDFAKISLVGNLRISNNVCEDAFSDKIYLTIRKDSQIRFTYSKYRNSREFILDYNNQYCIDSYSLIPVVYHICRQNPIPCKVRFAHEEITCKKIKVADKDRVELINGILYLPRNVNSAFEKELFYSFLEQSQEIKAVNRETAEIMEEISLKKLGISTVTLEGSGSLGYSIPINTSKIGGLPSDLRFKLLIAHTPIHQNDKAELRIYLNGRMIYAYLLEGAGKKSFSIDIPVRELFYGGNYLTINMVNFTSSDNCFGAVTHSAFTIFEDSYFYWSNLRNEPKTISDFFKNLHGRVALIIKDQSFYSSAAKLVSELGVYNKNIEMLDMNPENIQTYDFIISFENPEDTKGKIVDLSKGDFELVNPLTGRILFSSKPEGSFTVITLQDLNRKPLLAFLFYPDPLGLEAMNSYNFPDLLGLSGNVAIATKSFISAYEVGRKLRVDYEFEKDIFYYWDKYKIWVLLFLVIPISLFLLYVYRKLSRKPDL